jgi:hypothetical protein
MYTSFIKDIAALFITNSALAIMLLTGEYLMNTNLGHLLSQPGPQNKEELRSRTEKIYKLSDDLSDRCTYLKAFTHSPLSENEFLLEILNKEKIYLHHQHEVSLVLKKMIKKGTHLGKVVAKLLQCLPPKYVKQIFGVSEDEINHAFANPQPAIPSTAPSRKNSSRNLKPVTIMHKEKPELNTHQMRMAMFLGRIRAVLTITEKLYQNWGWRSVYAQQNKYMENYMIRQFFLLSHAHHFLIHETVFFNNPTLYLCFQKLYELISQIIEVLASVVSEGDWSDAALGPLGLVVTQIKFSAAKLVSVQYSSPGLFELL